MEIAGNITILLLFFALYFEVFLLVAFLERRTYPRDGEGGDASPLPALAHTPHVAIVIPCWNEAKTLGRTVESLLALAYPKDKLEVIVVDDGSTDDTYRKACAYAHDPRVRVFTKENGGKHSAMNYALARTDAELIGCLDADSEVAPDALHRIAAAFNRGNQVAAVTPGIHTCTPRTFVQYIQLVEYRFSIFIRYVFALLGSVFITPGPFSIFRAAVVRELGGWRYAHSTEDLEMGLRFQSEHRTISNEPRAIVHTVTPSTFLGLFRQRVRWTYGFLRNAIDYRYMIGNPRYGNLGILVLPAALLSIATVLYFFANVLLSIFHAIAGVIEYVYVTRAFPIPSFEIFYVNTSVMFLVMMTAAALMIVLIAFGSRISIGSHRIPASTPLFLVFYGLLVPIWLAAAVARATFNTGVRWR